MNEKFIKAVEKNDVKKVKLLIADNVDPSTDYNYAIRLASNNGYTEIVEILLKDKRVNPSTDYNYAIGKASENGYIEIVKLLLADVRVDPSDDANYAIRHASKRGHVEIVKLLLTDSRVNTPFIWKKIENDKMRNELLKEKREELERDLTNEYLSIKKGSPQVKFDRMEKSALPKEYIKKIVYEKEYSDLCDSIEGKIPPMKLIALANILKINYDMDKINWEELCGKVKANLLLLL
jgi:ankyrin repeat protein